LLELKDAEDKAEKTQDSLHHEPQFCNLPSSDHRL